MGKIVIWSLVAGCVVHGPLAMAREYNTTSMERAVVDMKPKDCLGNPLTPPASVTEADFVVTAKDLENNKVSPVPVRLLRYDSTEGVAEIIFPFRRGAVYDVDLAKRGKFRHADCPGQPVATE